MKVWIINPYATLPTEPWREDRHGVLANYLDANNHEVVIWTANFVHRSKLYRAEKWETIKFGNNIHYSIVPSTSYKKHISLDRILFEKNFSENFLKLSTNFSKPDVLILTEPSLFFQSNILEYLKTTNIKLIIDIIDLWPELFNIILPEKIRFLGKFIFKKFYTKRNKLIQKADGIVAVSENYLEILPCDFNKPRAVVYWGNDTKGVFKLSSDTLFAKKKKNEYRVIYAGTIGSNYDLNTVLETANVLKKLDTDISFIIAGDGPLKEWLMEKIASDNLFNVKYVGSLNSTELAELFYSSNLGLCSYVRASTVSMPIKIYDYLNYNIPILNSLSGDIKQLVDNKKIGLNYESENIKSLVDAIVILKNNTELQKSIKSNIKEVSDMFSYEKQYSKYVNFIEKIVHNGKSN